MADTGPNKGAQPRTLRGRALEIGTSSAGFVPSAPYDTQGGHPITDKMAKSRYEDVAEKAKLGSIGKTSQGENPIK